MAKKRDAIQKKAKSKELRCFIIMPFSNAVFEDSDGIVGSLNQRKLKHLYEKLLKRAVKEYNKKKTKFVSIKRYERTRGNFVKGIINDLDQADLVIADLTGLNPNVFYELGIRHTLKVGTIMLTQNLSSLPADLRSYVAFEYKYHEESDAFDEYYPKFKKKLHNAIDEYIEDYPKGEYDNPVRDFIGSRIIFHNEQRIKEVKGNIKIMEMISKEYINNINHLATKIEDWANGKSIDLLTLRNNAISFLNRLIMLNEKNNVINFITNYSISMQVIKHNMPKVMKTVIKAKDINASLNAPYGFVDLNKKEYHILELYKYHKDSSKPEECPIIKSFNKYISNWEMELESLTS